MIEKIEVLQEVVSLEVFKLKKLSTRQQTRRPNTVYPKQKKKIKKNKKLYKKKNIKIPLAYMFFLTWFYFFFGDCNI